MSNYNKNENVIRTERIECCMKHEQKVHAGHEFGAGKKLEKSFVLVRGESDRNEGVWAAKVLELFRCIVWGRD